jgi:hypothetical protein
MIKLKLQEYLCFRTCNVIKRTPQQYEKSNNVAQYGDQHNVALRRRNHKKKTQKENLIYVKITFLLKEEEKNCRQGMILGKKMYQNHPL